MSPFSACFSANAICSSVGLVFFRSQLLARRLQRAGKLSPDPDGKTGDDKIPIAGGKPTTAASSLDNRMAGQHPANVLAGLIEALPNGRSVEIAMLATVLKRVARKAGFDVMRHRPSFVDLMRCNAIKTVLDVGANEGQYAREIRELGYRGHILSFEPIRAVYDVLATNAAKDSNWTTYNMALGETDGQFSLAVSEKTVFSSFKSLSGYSEVNFPGAKMNRSEDVKVVRLDTFLKNHPLDLSTTYLKIDTQGFEKEVLIGAGALLESIRAVQAELALQPLYQDQVAWYEMIRWMQERGYRTVLAKENGIDRNRSELLELDVVFLNDAA